MSCNAQPRRPKGNVDWKSGLVCGRYLIFLSSMNWLPCLLVIATVIFLSQNAMAQIWPRFQGNRAATGLSQVNGPSAAKLKWKIKLNTWLSSAAIGPDGTVYVCIATGKLMAISSAGEVKCLFKFPASDPPPDMFPVEKREWLVHRAGGSISTHAPAVAPDGTIYLGINAYPHKLPQNTPVGLHAVDSDGTVKWFFQTPPGEEVTSSPNIALDGTIYFTTSQATYAVDTNGNQKWKVARDSSTVRWSSPAIGSDGTVYCVGSVLKAISSEGVVMWSYTPQSGTIQGFGAHPTVADDGAIYFGARTRLYAVNPDGSEKWVVSIGWSESSPAIGSDGTIYIGAGEFEGDPGQFIAVNPDDGSFKWTYIVDTAVDSSAIIGADGLIYFGSDDGFFYALTPEGTLKWSLDVGHNPGRLGEVDTSPAMASDGTIYFGHSGGPGEISGLYFYAVAR